MAYLKNKEYEKSVIFVEDCYKKGIINQLFREQMKEKLFMLHSQIDNLPISTSMQQTKETLKKMLPAIQDNERSLFIVIFTAIVSQRELSKLIGI